MHRLSRLPGSGYSIACGFACGAAISFTPFVGGHLLMGSAIAWALRGNIIAAWIGTLVGNPWTFPFIWLWLYKSGNWMLDPFSNGTESAPNFVDVFAGLSQSILSTDFDATLSIISSVILPMTISGIPTAIAVWIVFFFPMKKIVETYKRRRRRRIRRKRQAQRGGAAPIARKQIDVPTKPGSPSNEPVSP